MRPFMVVYMTSLNLAYNCAFKFVRNSKAPEFC